jgi:non-canonical purine NTP pyrophosphatase (RdgB/HAM1 family)
MDSKSIGLVSTQVRKFVSFEQMPEISNFGSPAVRIFYTMKLLIATGNEGKFTEIVHALEDLPFEFFSLKDTNLTIPDEIEDGTTYEENAEKKAVYCAQKTNMMTLADDSGLVVDALKDELGVFTRRWGAGKDVSDEEWLDYFMERMKSEENQNAMFVSCICVVDSTGNVIASARGESKGTITETIEAPIKPGIPLSSVFKVDGEENVHSAMSIQEKNLISHRGKALKKIQEQLQSIVF